MIGYMLDAPLRFCFPSGAPENRLSLAENWRGRFACLDPFDGSRPPSSATLHFSGWDPSPRSDFFAKR